MTAKEKFYARAEELGIEELINGGFGHYGVETENGVIILVHEDENDAFDEYRYPSMQTLSEDENLRAEMFDVFDCIEDFDNETIGALYLWKMFGNDYDSYPYPNEAGYSSVYFACEPKEKIHFEDNEKRTFNVQLIYRIDLNSPVEADNEEEALAIAKGQVYSRLEGFTEEEKRQCISHVYLA